MAVSYKTSVVPASSAAGQPALSAVCPSGPCQTASESYFDNLLSHSFDGMALFYTGKGDKGTSVIGKKKFPKDSPIIETLGDLDELNSLLGIIRSKAKKELGQKIFAVQENLFIIQARVAWLMFKKFSSPKITKAKIAFMEQEIEAMEKKIEPERGFIISGENTTASWLDYARSVARRAERSVVKLSKKHKLPQELLTYLNRLSSYFFALARLEISNKKIQEKKPQYK